MATSAFSVRLATHRDLGEMGRVLARAFDQDPVIRFVLGDHGSFSKRCAILMRILTSVHIDRGDHRCGRLGPARSLEGA
jgi:hypothetical protein